MVDIESVKGAGLEKTADEELKSLEDVLEGSYGEEERCGRKKESEASDENSK